MWVSCKLLFSRIIGGMGRIVVEDTVRLILPVDLNSNTVLKLK